MQKSYTNHIVLQTDMESNHKNSKQQDQKLKRKWRIVEHLAQTLGIQGARRDENLQKILKEAARRIELLEYVNQQKELQIRDLIKQNKSDVGLQVQVLELQRKVKSLESSTGSREQLIDRLKRQITTFKEKEKTMLQTIFDLKQQIWPPPFYDAN